jgi:tRNA(adenine34) deaminase
LILLTEDIIADIKEKNLFFMSKALRLARIAGNKHNEVPVGAVVVHSGRIVAAGFNCPITSKDPTAHAEIIALRRASKRIGAYRLPEAELYVTLEPCIMCIGAIIHARLKKITFAAPDPKIGVVSTGIYKLIEDDLNHNLDITGGLLAEEASSLLKEFFFNKRS